MIKKYAPHIGYGDLLDRCRQPGCPICRLGDEAVATYLKMVLYECVTDPTLREQLRGTFGYCRTHAWLLPALEKGNILGIAIIYEDILDVVRKNLPQIASERSKQSLFRRWLARFKRSARQAKPYAQPACPACELHDESGELALMVLLNALAKEDDQMRDALHASEGLCFTHLRQAFTMNQRKSVRDYLIGLTQEKLAATQAALKELIRKYDHRFQHEPVGDERESWKTAIRFLVGEK